MKSIPSQLIGEMTELGKTIVTETGKVPTELAGKALESFGSGSAKKQASLSGQVGYAETREINPLNSFTNAPDTNVKKVLARRALEWLSGKNRPKHEPSVYERVQMEKEERRKDEDDRAARSAFQELPAIRGPQKLGRYGIRAKHTEIGKNVRQD